MPENLTQGLSATAISLFAINEFLCCPLSVATGTVGSQKNNKEKRAASLSGGSKRKVGINLRTKCRRTRSVLTLSFFTCDKRFSYFLRGVTAVCVRACRCTWMTLSLGWGEGEAFGMTASSLLLPPSLLPITYSAFKFLLPDGKLHFTQR